MTGPAKPQDWIVCPGKWKLLPLQQARILTPASPAVPTIPGPFLTLGWSCCPFTMSVSNSIAHVHTSPAVARAVRMQALWMTLAVHGSQRQFGQVYFRKNFLITLIITRKRGQRTCRSYLRSSSISKTVSVPACIVCDVRHPLVESRGSKVPGLELLFSYCSLPQDSQSEMYCKYSKCETSRLI